MKHLFSFLFASLSSMLAWGQTTTLILELSAEGASPETVVDVYLTATPEFLEGPQTVSLLGDEDVTLAFSFPLETMQGVVTAYGVNCEGDSITAVTFMELQEEDSAGMAVLEAELDFPYCDDEEEEEEEFEGWDDDLDLNDLEAYLDSLCGQVLNPDAWMYCGLLESLNACLEGDTAACLDVDAWLDDVEWEWEDDEEEEEEEEEEETEMDCNATFTVMQAFGNDSLPVPNMLWVYVYDYDDDNEYLWSFGDEGTSTDPFPTWTYETDGPYELCLTVSNDEDSCSTTFCQTLSVDSLGWWTGIQDGFSIAVFDGGEGSSVATLEDVKHQPLAAMQLYPNPSQGGTVWASWNSTLSGVVEADILGLDGRIATSERWSVGLGLQQHAMNVAGLASGIYLVRLQQGDMQRVQRIVVR